MPEGLGFKAGDEVRKKDGSDSPRMILGFHDGEISLMNMSGQKKVTPEQLKDEYERVGAEPKHKKEHPLEDLV